MPRIVFKDVSFAYPNGSVAVDGVSLEIGDGASAAVIGRNGAGKTTLAKLMNGLCKPDAGTVLVGGADTRKFTAARLARTVGYVFQNPDDQIFRPTVISEVEFGPKNFGFAGDRKRLLTDYAIELAGLEGRRETNPYDLSFSERRFVSVAAVVAADTPVVIFDEPTSGQDPKGLRRLSRIMEELRGQGKTVIVITHNMEFAAENFPRIIVMADKKIAADREPREIFWDLNTLEAAGLKQPYISRICRELGLPGDIIRMDEAINALVERALWHDR